MQTSHCTQWSFRDGVLHGLVPQLPSQKGKSLNMQVLMGLDSKLNITVLDVPQCFSGQSPSSPCNNGCYNLVNVSLLQHGQAVSQLLKSQLVTSSISVKACGFMFNIWSQMLGRWPLDVGSWSSCYTGSTGADEPHKVFNYCGFINNEL